ncbi:type II secretion system protein [uncultured Oscillibacter sp.]|uniref:type II secretion system protein n=1 Tax=uncultured Oscillibacter sp. TaxID=876091 RepID=UPI0025F9B88C|nr:type II secretion system protein [uncultured Oscillibacter sp.]
MRGKRNRRGGFTMTEMLAAMLILGLMTAALVGGLPAVLHAYREATVYAESEVLCGTLSAALADELRTATGVKVSGTGGITFNSPGFGVGAAVGSTDDRVTVGGKDLVGERAYTSGLTAQAEAKVTPGGGELVTVKISVRGAGRTEEDDPWAEAEFSVRLLNPP